jgi:hypothetical protein
VISFTSLPLYPRGNNTRYSLTRRLVSLQRRSGRHGGVKIFPLPGLDLRPLGHPAHSYTDCAIPALRTGQCQVKFSPYLSLLASVKIDNAFAQKNEKYEITFLKPAYIKKSIFSLPEIQQCIMFSFKFKSSSF